MISQVSSKHTVFKVRIIIIFALSHPLSRRVQTTISFNLIHRRMFSYCNYEFILLIVGRGVWWRHGYCNIQYFLSIQAEELYLKVLLFLTYLKYFNTIYITV
jgi:hypothetical protein